MAYTARKESEVKEFFDEPSALDQKIKKLAELVKKSKHFCVYTGAGISTSCGIADYRSGINTVLKTGAGKWAKQAAHQTGKLSKKELSDLQKKQEKKKVSTFKAVPSPSHMALIALAKAGYLKHLISQNTDGLHRRSGFEIDSLSELHGNSTLEECPVCGKVYMRDFRCRNKAALPKGSLAKIKYICDEIQKGISNDSKYSNFITNEDKEFMTKQISKAYQFCRTQTKFFKDINQNKSVAQSKDYVMQQNKAQRTELLSAWGSVLNKGGFRVPRYLHNTGRYCAVKGCKGQLTDTIINFGESLPEQTLETAQKQSAKADLYLVLGSSCTVTPAADMPEEVGLKWKEELASLTDASMDTEHNLAICNIQKTPLQHLCSLPMYAKIDDVMCGLMVELGLEIPKWHLQRYMRLCVNNSVSNSRELCISGVDRDGTGFTLFKSIVLRNNGERIRKVINNKETTEGVWKYSVPIWDCDESVCESKENESIDKSKGLTVELEFYGHYEEPNLVIGLNRFLDEFVEFEGQIVLKMSMDPMTKVWSVPGKEEQMKDKNMKLLWRIAKSKNEKDGLQLQSNDIKKDE